MCTYPYFYISVILFKLWLNFIDIDTVCSYSFLSSSFSSDEPASVGGVVQPLQDQLGRPTFTPHGLQGGVPAALRWLTHAEQIQTQYLIQSFYMSVNTFVIFFLV